MRGGALSSPAVSSTALYTDLSRYYDLMCADIDYREQSEYVQRLARLFGNGGGRHLDLACGTGPHVRHFIDFGYASSGLDIHEPMLALARRRCPEATFLQGDMCRFSVAEPLDLITCYLYSIHYCQSIDNLRHCIAAVHGALNPGGLFCFNAVDRTTIDNGKQVRHAIEHGGSRFVFWSGWHYAGSGEEQQLLVKIEKHSGDAVEVWQDRHAMVAVSFGELRALLQRYFDVHVFEHRCDRIEPWDGVSGNAFFVCVRR